MKRNILSSIFGSLLTSFVFLEAAQAVVPAPDGGYPGGNTAEGNQALFSLNAGIFNTATGGQSLYSNTTGNDNTATGFKTLFTNTTGSWNTATGFQALYHMNVGCCSTATGYQALYNDINGDNTATGYQALFRNTSGDSNTATGVHALQQNRDGSWNTADGKEALYRNTRGLSNTATGFAALFSNTTGNDNTAAGFNALYSNTTDSGNTGVGEGALYFHTTGENNVAIGAAALSANRTGNRNIGIGYQVGQTFFSGNDNIYIGAPGGDESNTIRIGNTQTRFFTTGISGVAVGGSSVYVSSSGQLGGIASSARFKHDIHNIGDSSSVLLSLRPVSFRYNNDIDPAGTPQFGLVAEEVQKVSPELVVHDNEGKPYSVRYDQVNAMLLNEFLKEHWKIEQMQKQIEALTAGLQKMSAQLEPNKSALQTVLNNQ